MSAWFLDSELSTYLSLMLAHMYASVKLMKVHPFAKVGKTLIAKYVLYVVNMDQRRLMQCMVISL